MKKLALEIKQVISPKDVKITLIKSKNDEHKHISFEPKGKYGENAIKALEKRLKTRGIPSEIGKYTGSIWLSAVSHESYLKTLHPSQRERVEKQLSQKIKRSNLVRKLYGELKKLKFKEKEI